MKRAEVTKPIESEEYLEKPKEKKQQRLDAKVKASTKRTTSRIYKEDRWN